MRYENIQTGSGVIPVLIPMGLGECLEYFEKNLPIAHRYSDKLPHAVATGVRSK